MMPSLRFASTLWCLGAAQVVLAQSADPLQSLACRDALGALQVQEQRAASAPAALTPDTKAALKSARRRAASACLAQRDDKPVLPSRTAQPPLAVPPIAVLPRTPAPAAAADPSRPVPVTPPPVPLRNCDAVGCWISDGTRLQRVGPGLLGPRGFCTTSGAVVSCP